MNKYWAAVKYWNYGRWIIDEFPPDSLFARMRAWQARTPHKFRRVWV